MLDFSHKHLVDRIINCTDTYFDLYEQNTGDIVRHRQNQKPPKAVPPLTGLAIRPQELEAYVELGYSLEALVLLVDEPSDGRPYSGGHPEEMSKIGKLVWAANPKIQVVLYNSVEALTTAHL